MKFNAPTSRLAMLGLMGLLMAAAIAFVVLRSGPLALVRVTVAQATQGSITPALFGIDTVEVRRSYLVGPTAAGRVLRVLVDAGDTVEAGQLLAEMDPVDLDHRLAALDASVARAASAIAAADAQKVDMAARRELAAITTRRYADLGRQNFVSASAVEAKLQEQTSADAGARAAQANLAGAQQDLARLKGERAALVQQRQNARLVAASDSIVLSRDAEPGSTVVAGQAVLRLIEPGSLWVKARFDQGRSAGLVNGLAADIVLRASADRTTPGKVLRMELQGDSVTEDRVAQIAVGALPPPVLRWANWPRSRCACRPPRRRRCCPMPPSSATPARPAPGGWSMARLRSSRCVWGGPAWMARYRCWRASMRATAWWSTAKKRSTPTAASRWSNGWYGVRHDQPGRP